MLTKFRKWLMVAVVPMAVLGLLPLTALAVKGKVPPGQPFQALQAEIEALQTLIQENLISNHFQEISFSLNPGDSKSFALPKKQVPVRIEITFTLENGGTQTPSEVMFAVVNQDPVSNHMTWVGTNNDSTSQAGNTSSPPSTVIANIFGGGAPTVNASLEVDDLTASTLKVVQHSGTTIIPGSYIVHLWF